MWFDLLRHGRPYVDPVVVACCNRERGCAQHEAEEKLPEAEPGVRHGDE